ncbi:MAG: DUF503 domain-containing protein [Acidimicrobiia bacterium]|nr:DUF503 domain-containing protein [Acidimicrobiia bacterium]
MHLAACHSLKGKRAVLRPITEGIRSRFRVSVAEVDHHDLWQRATIGAAVVGATIRHVEQQLDEVERFIWRSADVEVIRTDRWWLEDR